MKILLSIYGKLPSKMQKIIKKCLGKKEKKEGISKQQLINKLLKFDVVSFDIFDTLISRAIFNPDDIFKIMEEKLVDIKLKDSVFNMRKNAEKSAIEKLHKDPNIDEIYFELANIYNYDIDTINKIKGLEVDLEIKFAIPRKDMIEVLNKLVLAGKKVVLTSDMYLNANIIEKMLTKCGYIKGTHYHKMYVSNDKNKRKDNGSMWQYLKILYSGMKLVHVGDNIHSDYNIPTQLGIKAINILNPREQLRLTEYCNGINYFIENRSISDSIYLGYLINEVMFNSPFQNNISSLEVVSKTFIAPMMYELIKFVDENTKENDKLLFLAREGYYLEKLFADYINIFNKNSKEHYYFLASRRATMSATLFSKEDVISSINREYNGTIKSLLENIYGVKYNDNDFKIKLPDEQDKIKNIIEKYSDDIINNSKNNRKAYMKYINDMVNIKKDNLVIVDLGYSGTIQYHLSKMLDKDLVGLYLTNSSSVKKFSSQSELKFAFNICDDQTYEKIYHYSLILEFFLSAPYGQLQYFKETNDSIEPIYNEEKMDDAKKKTIEEIYSFVKQFIERIAELNEIYNIDINKKLLCNSNTAIVESNLIDRKIKDRFDFVDSFNDTESKNVFKIISRY